ncbi:MAG: M3 family metallopeptidase, partial [Chloroflexota bacterium]|nr:M3 family metallopeptidase [Chloroflexota bacterium]
MLYDYAAVTPSSVASETDDALATADALVDGLIAGAEAPSFEASLLPLERAGAALIRGYGRGAFLGQAHPDADVRTAGHEAEERLDKWRVAILARPDVYRAVRAFADTDAAAALTGEDARLLEHWLRDFRRAGQDLPEADREELERLNNRLVEIKVAFQRNINDYRDGLDLTKEQLAGLPDSYVERLKPGEEPGTYRVSLDYPEIGPFMERAHDRGLRRELYVKDWNKAADANRPLLAEALELRHRIAGMLGRPTWAHHAMEVKMARSPERVRDFYATLLPALDGEVAADLEGLRAGLAADGHDEAIQPWDWRYYHETMRRTEYGVDQE